MCGREERGKKKEKWVEVPVVSPGTPLPTPPLPTLTVMRSAMCVGGCVWGCVGVWGVGVCGCVCVCVWVCVCVCVCVGVVGMSMQRTVEHFKPSVAITLIENCCIYLMAM